MRVFYRKTSGAFHLCFIFTPVLLMVVVSILSCGPSEETVDCGPDLCESTPSDIVCGPVCDSEFVFTATCKPETYSFRLNDHPKRGIIAPNRVKVNTAFVIVLANYQQPYITYPKSQCVVKIDESIHRIRVRPMSTSLGSAGGDAGLLVNTGINCLISPLKEPGEWRFTYSPETNYYDSLNFPDHVTDHVLIVEPEE